MHSFPIYTVTEVTERIKTILRSDNELFQIWVKGEISNLKLHSSGHLYFSLKDETAKLKCVMFKGAVRLLHFEPRDGMAVLALGSISVYERSGEYQLYVELLEPDGVGGFYLAFQQLKDKLAKEGLFDEAAKKPLPSFVQTVGVITSPTGAAIRDIINVARRRFPGIKILLAPALVQGDEASKSIIKSLKILNDNKLVDVIIIARGGGSIEELWCFNDEGLARAVFASEIPVVSAVGHETDFTVIDFVADFRAPTPSAAAELVVPSVMQLKSYITHLQDNLLQVVMAKTRYAEARLEIVKELPIFTKPYMMLEPYYQSVDRLADTVMSYMMQELTEEKHRLSLVTDRVSVLDPLATLKRGYSVIRRVSDGSLVKSFRDVEHDDMINVYTSDGSFNARVIKP
jgi:exodeoxyribonuclease VII large subunit